MYGEQMPMPMERDLGDAGGDNMLLQALMGGGEQRPSVSLILVTPTSAQMLPQQTTSYLLQQLGG